ncbi:MAG: hypothetical protein LUG96_13665 [Tannerellaceae bacterium]|nr:hypothetical protein [Tannerellaceae bacterium]MCD7916194.1 hypothetical protein [Tannerellaceae bacterium]
MLSEVFYLKTGTAVMPLRDRLVNPCRTTISTLYTLAPFAAYIFGNQCLPMQATLYTLRIVAARIIKNSYAAI